MVTAVFAIPGDIDLPTGGYTYDRRVLALLPEFGVSVRHAVLPGSFPVPTTADLDETGKIFAAVPPDSALLIDGLAYGALPAATLARARAPIIALIHHPLCLEAGLGPELQRNLRRLETAALARAARVVVTSPTTARLLGTEFDVAAENITVAEPGTDPAPRARGTGRPLQLLGVGSVIPRKGYDVLVAALAPLSALEWQLEIAGALDRSEETAAHLVQAIAWHGLESRVRLLGPVAPEALASHYERADVFVLASLYEGYGMVLAEAMARGLPIVCTTGGAAAQTVPDGAAIKVAPGDATALREALRRVIEDAGTRRQVGDAAWAAAKLLPRWQDTAGRIAGVIKDLA